MYNKKPPFEVTAAMLDRITEIGELVGAITAAPELKTNPVLRRSNRIRSIYSSLAIEQNTLSLEQVTAVLNGKRVLAPPKDIAEVQNAYEIYEMLDRLDPYSVEDLLDAHGVMTRGLVRESGCFRSACPRLRSAGSLESLYPREKSKKYAWGKPGDIYGKKHRDGTKRRPCIFFEKVAALGQGQTGIWRWTSGNFKLLLLWKSGRSGSVLPG